MLAINAHWLPPDFQQYRACIEFVGIDRAHSGENLVNIVATVLDRFHISAKVMTITADNASNNDTLHRFLYQKLSERYDEYLSEVVIREGTMRFTQNSQISCFAHILNLVMKSILRSLQASSYKEAAALLNDIAKRVRKQSKRLRLLLQNSNYLFFGLHVLLSVHRKGIVDLVVPKLSTLTLILDGTPRF